MPGNRVPFAELKGRVAPHSILVFLIPSTGPRRLGRGERNRLGLEVAEAIAIEPALAEPEAASQHFLEHLSLEGADRPIGFGQLEVRARMLPQYRDRHARILRDFGLNPSVKQQIGELDKPPFPLIAADLGTIHLGHSLRHANEKVTP